jgi:hypothetical protein
VVCTGISARPASFTHGALPILSVAGTLCCNSAFYLDFYGSILSAIHCPVPLSMRDFATIN